MKQIDGQLDLFSIDYTPRVKPCECGNSKLAVHITGCGIPVGGYTHYPLVFDSYLYFLFCPKCLTAAGCKDEGWRSNKLSMDEALKDWNTYKRHNPRYDWEKSSLAKSANEMPEIINIFPSVIEVLGINNVYTGAE